MKSLTKSLLVTAGAVALTGILAAPASANPVPPGTVTVTTNDGGVQVGTALPGQPLLGVSADSRGVCVGFSLQQGHCVPVSAN